MCSTVLNCIGQEVCAFVTGDQLECMVAGLEGLYIRFDWHLVPTIEIPTLSTWEELHELAADHNEQIACLALLIQCNTVDQRLNAFSGSLLEIVLSKI
jgi:hypothetical protein